MRGCVEKVKKKPAGTNKISFPGLVVENKTVKE